MFNSFYYTAIAAVLVVLRTMNTASLYGDSKQYRKIGITWLKQHRLSSVTCV